MLSHKKIKQIQSLQRKKFRQKYNLFFVEGIKSTKEIVKSDFEIDTIYSIEPIEGLETSLISAQEMKKISALTHPSIVFCVAKIPENKRIQYSQNSLLLDDIQDPGNLGTIIRTADWFGVSQIVASQNTVDVFNPKVVQASMGSFTRVSFIYADLEDFIVQFKGKVYTADMGGDSIYKKTFESPFALLLGNEGNGVSSQLLKETEVISIPHFSPHQETESLNVGIANAIILSEIASRESGK